MRLENLGITQSRRTNLCFFVQTIHRLGPREMADAWPPVSVLCVRGVETHGKAKGFPLWVTFQKLHCCVAAQFRLMPSGAVRLFFEIGVAANCVKRIEHFFLCAPWHAHSIFPDEARAITRRAQPHGVAILHVRFRNWRRTKGVPMRALVQSGENRGAAGGTNRSGHKHIWKARALGGQPVEIRRFQNWMPRAAEPVPAMVIRQKENQVWPRRGVSGAAQP